MVTSEGSYQSAPVLYGRVCCRCSAKARHLSNILDFPVSIGERVVSVSYKSSHAFNNKITDFQVSCSSDLSTSPLTSPELEKVKSALDVNMPAFLRRVIDRALNKNKYILGSELCSWDWLSSAVGRRGAHALRLPSLLASGFTRTFVWKILGKYVSLTGLIRGWKGCV